MRYNKMNSYGKAEMSMVRRICALLLACALLACATASAERVYIIGDSDTRELTYAELWGWNRESVNYIYNEILARHGYVFEPGGKYDNYFRAMPWYQPNADPDNRTACYPQLSGLEWQNIRLCKKVMNDMIAQRTTNPEGKSVLEVCDFPAGGLKTLSGFEYCPLKGGQLLPVYAAPSEAAWRGANGKAALSTNGAPYAAGWDGAWLLVMYEIGTAQSTGAMRSGYVRTGRENLPELPELVFSRQTTAVSADCVLTDDPVAQQNVMRTLKAGETVIYLTTFYGDSAAWDYIETTVDGQVARGFVPSGSLTLAEDEIDDAEWPDGSNG